MRFRRYPAVLPARLADTRTRDRYAVAADRSEAKKAGRPMPEVKGYAGMRATYDATELADFLGRETAKNGR
jgi:hypothetical protein